MRPSCIPTGELSCIYQNSNPKGIGSKARLNIDTQARAINFRSEFGNVSNYGIPTGYFQV